MITKVYAIHGKSTVSLRIPTGKNGKAYILCEFQRGRPLLGANYRPATYATSSAIEQDIIEGSQYFKNKTISIYRQFGQSDGPVVTSNEKLQGPAQGGDDAGKVKEPVMLGEVTDRESLIEALKAHGAKAAVLASEDKMKAYMEKNNIVTPNFQF